MFARHSIALRLALGLPYRKRRSLMSITLDREFLSSRRLRDPWMRIPRVLRSARLRRVPVLCDYDLAVSSDFTRRSMEKVQLGVPHIAHAGMILQGEPRARGGERALPRSSCGMTWCWNLRVWSLRLRGSSYWAKRYCGELLEIRVPFDEVIDPAQVAVDVQTRADIRAGRRLSRRHAFRNHQSGARRSAESCGVGHLSIGRCR